mmetsp:Transcript_61530/g.171992  ORF Transcript_61530/g.171992 Transcript_61530/m.171992 type:complete len:104 (-) Transcript_61530:239-550(-)
MAGRSMLLPALFVAAALVLTLGGSGVFVGGRVQQAGPALRAGAARGALPAGLENLAEASSVSTALAVSTPGWWANIVLLITPCAFLVILYLASEKSKKEGYGA